MTILIVIILFAMSSSAVAFAWDRSTPNVPPDSPLYRDLDKIVAFGFVRPPVLGQRPYPRSEFARMTAEAIKEFEGRVDREDVSYLEFARILKKKRQIEMLIARLKAEFEEELIDMGVLEGEKRGVRVHALEDFIFYETYLNSPPTTIPPNNGRGPINALVNPLRDYDVGRPWTDGFQSAYEMTGRLEASRYFSGYVRPRFVVNEERVSGAMTAEATLQNAYGTFRAGNFMLLAGRESMLWGIGERGGLLFSTNPRPLDGFRVTNPTPARLPWFFKYLGEWRYTLFGATLGPSYSQKWAWLMGYKFSLEPAKYVELGFGHVVMIGGEGMPNPSFVDVVGEFAGFRPSGTERTSANISNHIFELEAMVRIVPLRGMQLYGDMAIEDKWKSITKTLTQGCGYLFGMYLPALNSTGSMDLRAEYVMMSPVMYRHSLFTGGYTLDRKLIGTDAGPDADSLHLKFRQTVSPKIWYGLTFGWDLRRSNTYTELANPDGTAGPVVQTASGPTEKRYRGIVDLDWQPKKRVGLRLTVGCERATNLHFQQGVGRNNYLAAVALRLNFDDHFSFAAR